MESWQKSGLAPGRANPGRTPATKSCQPTKTEGEKTECELATHIFQLSVLSLAGPLNVALPLIPVAAMNQHHVHIYLIEAIKHLGTIGVEVLGLSDISS